MLGGHQPDLKTGVRQGRAAAARLLLGNTQLPKPSPGLASWSPQFRSSLASQRLKGASGGKDPSLPGSGCWGHEAGEKRVDLRALSVLTWQPAFSSIWAYFTVLSISGKTRILHVTGTESFSWARRTGENESRLLTSVPFTSGRLWGAPPRTAPLCQDTAGPGWAGTPAPSSRCRVEGEWLARGSGFPAPPAAASMRWPGLTGHHLRAPLPTTTQPDPTLAPARSQLTHSLEQVPLLLQEGTVVTCTRAAQSSGPVLPHHTWGLCAQLPELKGTEWDAHHV